MKPATLGTILIHCAAWLAWSQSPDTPPKFEIADVHISAKTPNPFLRITPARGGRYELKFATMVDLIRIAYGYDADKVLGGPSWLEMDRFDVLAKVPEEATAETQKLMLQSLLQDRFKLVLHKETKPLPTYALTAGKKPLLKPSDGTEETGCRPQAAPAGGRSEGGIIMMMSRDGGGTTSTIALGPGMVIQYMCRNMTMAAFAEGLRGMLGASVGPNPVLDETGLKGVWNFDLRWSLQLNGLALAGASNDDRISIFEAVDKQLGLKLEDRHVPTPVIVVDSVNEKPTANPPGLAEALPPVPAPTEFEVASVKTTDPDVRGGRYQMQPGGRLTVQGMAMRFLVMRAFNVNNSDQVAGLPKWADTERYDITAKAPSEGPSAPAMDPDAMAPMIRALLVDRFKMTYHTEDRPVTAYSLVPAKPKMKKADPASRTSCKNAAAPAGSPPGSQMLTCQNITMAQFADRLQNMSPELNWPVLDATGIEGGWDFTLLYTRSAPMMAIAGRGGEAAPAAAGDAAPASDPNGGYTLFQAVEKQLGLKLEMQKRPAPIIVIDRLEQKPTEN
jgi:uncharacterized protein (TIGR03435 family)